MNDSSDVHDPNPNHGDTAMKCRKKEQPSIANYISILKIAVETPGRTYNKKEFIKALGNVKVQLNDKDVEERAKRKMEQACTEDKGAMTSLIDELFENVSRNPGEGTDRQPINLNVVQTGKDIMNIGTDNREESFNEDGI